MPVVESEFSSITINGETSIATIEFNNVNNLILAYILRGNISRRTVLAARGIGNGQEGGTPNAPLVRLNLAPQQLRMVPGDDGGVRTPPGLLGITEWARPGR